MDSTILLTNYPRIKQFVQFEEITTKESLDAVFGYDINPDTKAVTLQIANDLITALLIYDKVYVEASHIWDIIQVWGSEYLKELLRLNFLQVIPDQGLNPVIKRAESGWKVGFFAYGQHTLLPNESPRIFQPHKWSHIENQFRRAGIAERETNALIYLINENSVNIDEDDIIQRATEETISDLHNQLLLNQYKLINPISGKLAGADFPKLLRLQELNKTAVLASILKTDCVKADAEINLVLALKSSSEFASKYKNGIDILNKIEYEKGFPDLGELFISQIIKLDDILKLRNDFQGKIFRYWAQSIEYDEKLMRQEIMSLVHNALGNNISNAIRMLACNFIGLTGFVPGTLASCIDSFILNKIANGWHPNFFLDNKVKNMLDKCIAIKEQEQKKKLAQYCFKDIGRNDPCPCGSKKKFKYCHGKVIY